MPANDIDIRVGEIDTSRLGGLEQYMHELEWASSTIGKVFARHLILCGPDAKLQSALTSFKDALKPPQRSHFQAYRSSLDPDAIVRLTAEIDTHQAQLRQQCIGTRLQYLLESDQQFLSVIDTFV